MNNILIVTVLALGLAVAQNSIAGQENDSGIVDFDYTGSVVETNVMTDESAGVGIIPHQEGYDGLPIQEPGMNASRPGRSRRSGRAPCSTATSSASSRRSASGTTA